MYVYRKKGRVHETIVAMEKRYYIFLCVRARALVRACVCGCKDLGLCFRVCSLIQHATRMRHVVDGLWLHRIIRHYLINGTIFGKKKVTESKMRVLISPQLLFSEMLS